MATSERKTKILSSIHKTAAGLHRAGVIDKAALSEIDTACLSSPPSAATEEKKAPLKP
jgi:putative transcriptional regulator